MADTFRKDMDEIIALSRLYGADPEFVIAGGGNTSVKTADVLHVKSSGFSLATIADEGFVAIDRARIHALLESRLSDDPTTREEQFKQAIMDARLEPARGQRPSVECAIHNLLPARLVVHTHATWVNMISCCRDGERIARELFGDTILWIPFVDPGYMLARSIKDALAVYTRKHGRAPEAILLDNHGLIVCGRTADEVRARTNALLARVKAHIGPIAADAPPAADARAVVNRVAPLLRGLLSEGRALKVVRFDDSPEVRAFVSRPDAPAITANGPLTPDQIVYCTSYPMWLDADMALSDEALCAAIKDAIAAHVKARRFAPKVVLVRSVGLFAIEDNPRNVAAVGDVYLDAIKVMLGAARLGGVDAMTDAQRLFIEDWEVEAYRKKISAAAAARGRVAGKVALVTGAAQGFGLEIAQSLAAEGAFVVLADLNIDAARRETDAINRAAAGPVATAIPVNVTSQESVRECLDAAVRALGGLDLLVANAGVLRAGSVKTQAERDFDFVTAVNYKGYFLCVQAAAPIMAVQRRARPDVYTDIIQINSKSGLAGSNRNGAYAGSKFGGIGLTQSFALELIEDGIKVNSICPGNFFDGPLWSDPSNGLFVQYLRTGKVPGARTLDDVRRFYEDKVPMRRGCRTADVMRAIYYLVEQEYETGQAVPVTGGQVMLN